MRLFAAVLPPRAAVEELALLVEELRRLPGADGLRWTSRPGWHYTLAFMGEVEEALLPELSERLARAARRTGPFPLRVRGGGRFGHRALWAGAAGGLDDMRLLAERSDAAARRAGVAMDEHRRYQAHLTLARGRADTDLRPFVTELEHFKGGRWEVAELALVRSNLPVSGVPGEAPRYETIATWPLGGQRPAAG
ncbi:RNA 2',3'-cyclic phosphodiesterase [Streptomyces somaliensis DSM 40738]|uniref:RNA 2',3'-cyclic phosphodiesterase n=1 Tax=Streptomyces somaliensis (strain ATCC 33201 / DSM 40738 / JCM 12659 / KCTC 9044 / NCTC 11332 / NRRL B-12077 / IP 733) TaxID=1134445 RepID=A0AA44DEX7_STRE0|nr:RNA 2',3'-cyclic phosphodiesterase [Streptomyces somaliensis]MCQ0023282.1 RNA 2',3'-cyclic phosphodiesterase [Streptomyces somaliensis DSM 40738]NKY14876.1 RNA 2',3'-cyclic phosphodiesterase [Streptomyces somaliensis DSM 40738]